MSRTSMKLFGRNLKTIGECSRRYKGDPNSQKKLQIKVVFRINAQVLSRI
jgi:hypothetical protein